MKLKKIRGIVKEEIENFLLERTSTKILNSKKLNKRLKNHIKNKFGENAISWDPVRKSIPHDEWEVPKRVTLLIPEEVHEGMDLSRFLKPLGYYVAESFKDAQFDTYHYTLYPYKTKEIRDPQGPLYHVTPKNKLLKIKRKGLVPKKSSKDFDVDEPRIYFVESVDEVDEKIQVMKKNLPKFMSKKPPFGKMMAVLKIDPLKVNVSFYRDPETKGWGLFTNQNIPSSTITNWEDYRLELKFLKKWENR